MGMQISTKMIVRSTISPRVPSESELQAMDDRENESVQGRASDILSAQSS
jgi:hypothetical protein